MRRLFPILLSLAGAAWLASPAAAQSPGERMRACEGGEPGVPLVGTVTDAATGQTIIGAMILVDDDPRDLSDEDGCYSVFGDGESLAGRRRVRVEHGRYEAADTVLELSDARSDTVHFALRPFGPPCCRLEGEWSIRLTLLDRGGTRIRPRANTLEGRMVFSERLPSSWDEETDPAIEQGRFDVDLTTFFGGRYAPDVSTTVFGPQPSDFLFQAGGEVLADDSVMILMIPGMSHGGLSLNGTIRGDTVRGAWIQNAYCCGASGRFEMHRVPPSPEGGALVERGVRAMAELREAAEKEAAARAARMGHLRLRVWDEGTQRYVSVAFAAEGHEDNPGGGTSSLAYESGEDGWGHAYAFEPGRYDLLVYEFTCDGEIQLGHWVDADETTPRWTVTIETGRQTDLDIRLDVCAIPHVDLSDFDEIDDDEQVPAVVPAAPVP